LDTPPFPLDGPWAKGRKLEQAYRSKYIGEVRRVHMYTAIRANQQMFRVLQM